MKVLIGTTNPAKVKRFAEFLPDSGVLWPVLRLCDLIKKTQKPCGFWVFEVPTEK